MTNHSIIVRQDLEVSIVPDAYQLRAQALEASALIGKVTDEATKQVAVEAQILLKEIVDQCEQSRVAVKAPVLETGRLIDAIAKQYASEAKLELMRLSKEVGDYEALQLANLRAAQQAQSKELNAAEKQRWDDIAKAKSHDEIDAINERFAQQQAALQAQLPSIQRFDHQRVTEDWEIKVDNIHMLYAAAPICVKMEPKLIEIKQLLDKLGSLPGVTAKKVTKSGVKK